jgi:selenocysteine lyase/cysteine desulfurase
MVTVNKWEPGYEYQTATVSGQRFTFEVKSRKNYFSDAMLGVPYSWIQVSTQAVAGEFYKQDVNSKDFRVEESRVVEETRKKVAEYFGTKPKNIAFGNNTTECIDLVFHLMNFKKGDEIIVSEAEYKPTLLVFQNYAHLLKGMKQAEEKFSGFFKVPKEYFDEVGLTIPNYGILSGMAPTTFIDKSYIYAEKIKPEPIKEYETGVVIKVAKFGKNETEFIENIRKLITDKTRMIFVSHVSRQDGRILPVEKIAKLAEENSTESRRVYTLIDGAQAVGNLHPRSLQLENMRIDFYATCSHKFLCSEASLGMLYINPKNQELLENLSNGDFNTMIKEHQFHPDFKFDQRVRAEFEKVVEKLKENPEREFTFIELSRLHPTIIYRINKEGDDPADNYLNVKHTASYWMDRITNSRLSIPEVCSLSMSFGLVDNYGKPLYKEGKIKVTGWDYIEIRQKEMRDYFVNGLREMEGVSILSPLDERGSLGIITFSIDGIDSKELRDKLEKKGMFISYIDELKAVRVSFSMLNEDEEVWELMKKLKEIVGEVRNKSNS